MCVYVYVPGLVCVFVFRHVICETGKVREVYCVLEKSGVYVLRVCVHACMSACRIL